MELLSASVLLLELVLQLSMILILELLSASVLLLELVLQVLALRVAGLLSVSVLLFEPEQLREQLLALSWVG